MVTTCCAQETSKATRGHEGGSIMQLSDAKLVEKIRNRDGETATKAAKEIFRRGERMIPLLLKLKGNREQYLGGWLGSENAAFLAPVKPSPNPELGELVSTEIVALYLITAIYEGRLDFAQSPFLSDLTIPPDMRRAGNTPNRISRAWDSVEKWAKATKEQGLGSMRTKGRGPLSEARVAFW